MNEPETTNQIPQHHPSCRPADTCLHWKCEQCGLEADASEVLDEIEALRAGLNLIRKLARKGLDESKDVLTDISLECTKLLKETQEGGR